MSIIQKPQYEKINGQSYLVDRQEGHKSTHEMFCKGDHQIQKKIFYDFEGVISDIHMTCEFCGHGVIYWNKLDEEIIDELYQYYFQSRVEQAEKSCKATYWEFPSKHPKNSVLCCVLGHDFCYQTEYVDSQGNETWLDVIDDVNNARIWAIRGWCSRCDHRCIEVTPSNTKKSLIKQKIF